MVRVSHGVGFALWGFCIVRVLLSAGFAVSFNLAKTGKSDEVLAQPV